MTGPERVQRDIRLNHSSLPQIIISHSKAAGSASKRPSKQPPRPQNAWILYRQWALANLLKEEPELQGVPQSQLSKRLGAMWKEVDAQTRSRFEQQANLLKQQHAIEYPDYQFRPVKKSVKQRVREERKHEKARAKEAGVNSERQRSKPSALATLIVEDAKIDPGDVQLPGQCYFPSSSMPVTNLNGAADSAAIEVHLDAGSSANSSSAAQAEYCYESRPQGVDLLSPDGFGVQIWPRGGMDVQAETTGYDGTLYNTEGSVSTMTPDCLSTNSLSTPPDSLPTLSPLFLPTDYSGDDHFFENGVPTLTVANSFNDLCDFTSNDFMFNSDFVNGFGEANLGLQSGYYDLEQGVGCSEDAQPLLAHTHTQFDPYPFISEQI